MRKICALLTALLLVCGFAVTASAQEIPNLEENGTITFTVTCGEDKLNGGEMTIYRVGDIVAEDGNYSFSLVEELSESGLSLDNTDDPALAAQLANLAVDAALAGVTAPIVDGKARFENVMPGLYVVVHSVPTLGYAAMSPFLISMPWYQDGVYHTDVTAHPKVPVEPAPTEGTEPPVTEPPEPSLPQTGQLNWPVPLLAVLGLCMFAAGWALRFGRKKENYEK